MVIVTVVRELLVLDITVQVAWDPTHIIVTLSYLVRAGVGYISGARPATLTC